MKKTFVKILAIAAAAATLFAGCGIDQTATFATLDDKTIPLGFANFVARYQQASYDMFYVGYFGEDYWQTDLMGTGSDMETEIKASVADSIKEMYVLDAHKSEYNVDVTTAEMSAMSDAAWEFISANDKKTIKALGATQDYITEYLRLSAISVRMKEAISESIEYDEDALREEARAALESEAAAAETEAAEGDAEAEGTAEAEDTTAEPAEITDEEVEARLAELIEDAKSTGCTEKIQEWVDAASWEIDEDQWAKVKFDSLFKAPEEEAIEEDTEAEAAEEDTGEADAAGEDTAEDAAEGEDAE